MTYRDITSNAPPSAAEGDDRIAVLKHGIYTRAGADHSLDVTGAEIIVKNISGKIIGSALFEAVFYDSEGNILDTVEYKAPELWPDTGRTMRITSSKPGSEGIRSYRIRVIKTTTPPEPAAEGDDRIIILSHKYSGAVVEDKKQQHRARIDMAIRNVSDKTVATVLFKAVFYDIEGNIVETVKHKETDMRPGFSRAFYINSAVNEEDELMSYDVRVIRTTTVDMEKVQLGWYRMIRKPAGEVEIVGKMKNISDIKTDAVLIATFYNPERERAGSKVVIEREIEPGAVRQFSVGFEPEEGERVADFNIDVGEIGVNDSTG